VIPTADQVRHIIRDHDANRPRSRQTSIGVSEIGHPCARRLVHKITGTKPTNAGDPLAAYIGTAVHAALAEAIAAHGWRTEVPVTVPGYGLRGNVDAWHVADGLVLDWKVVGDTALRLVKASGPGEQYRTQIHTYGMALDLHGDEPDRAPISDVLIVFVPRSGRLANLHVWSEPYDEGVAEAGLRRLDALRTVAPLGPALAPATESFCSWCPYFLPGVTDLSVGCPGVPAAANPVTATIADTLGTNRRTA
jgi:hypothetical protein